jgi:hypothetical protein
VSTYKRGPLVHQTRSSESNRGSAFRFHAPQRIERANKQLARSCFSSCTARMIRIHDACLDPLLLLLRCLVGAPVRIESFLATAVSVCHVRFLAPENHISPCPRLVTQSLEPDGTDSTHHIAAAPLAATASLLLFLQTRHSFFTMTETSSGSFPVNEKYPRKTIMK